jgi:regulator of PEP synthase PpsR (kinase-PPPase family)
LAEDSGEHGAPRATAAFDVRSISSTSTINSISSIMGVGADEGHEHHQMPGCCNVCGRLFVRDPYMLVDWTVTHSADNLGDYHRRIEAVNFALSHDDGISTRDLGEADIVLVGVSRSGKTPTCLYMALQYGIRTANYPLVAEDFQRNALPPQLHALRRKLYGLTIQPERLQVVRNERRPGSRYSTLANCQFEVRAAEALMRQEGVPYIDTTRKSIEEIAATILHDTRLVRHVY